MDSTGQLIGLVNIQPDPAMGKHYSRRKDKHHLKLHPLYQLTMNSSCLESWMIVHS